MNIGFYIDEMNYRGVANSTFQFALNNEKILKNNSIIFYEKNNRNSKKDVLKKFKKNFISVGVLNFKEIDKFKKRFNLDYIYMQKSGDKDIFISKNIKTLVHSVYPQKLNQVHGHNYAYISEWLSKKFSNSKIPFVPYITESKNHTLDLRKKLKIKKNFLVLGCHGGETSFDLRFSHAAILKTVKIRKDIYFLFLNIKKFCNHPQIKFLKGTSNDDYKKKFINTCDAMIYGRSLGESFGLACAEFAIKNKSIISYKFNKHRSHRYHIPNKNFYEYCSYNSLIKLLINLKKKSLKKNYNSKYKYYSKKKVMKIFQNVFLKGEKKIQFSFFDFFINYFSHFLMTYFYLRHKLYSHFFKYIESKFLMNSVEE